MLYRISVAERGLTDIANIFRSCLSGLDDLLRAGTVPLKRYGFRGTLSIKYKIDFWNNPITVSVLV